MEVVGAVKDGKVELPASVHLAEGAEVRVIVAPEALAATQPFESEPVGEANVIADHWASIRFVIVVADAGPILHLHWIGCLPWGLPPRRIRVVEQVWTEIIQHAPEALDDPRLEREPVVELDPHLQA